MSATDIIAGAVFAVMFIIAPLLIVAHLDGWWER